MRAEGEGQRGSGVFRQPAPQQEERRDRPEASGRQGALLPAARRAPTWCSRTCGLARCSGWAVDYRPRARAQPADHLLLDLRLRPGRAVSRSRRARSDRAGRERHDQRHRPARAAPASAPACRSPTSPPACSRRSGSSRRSTRASAPAAASSSTCRCSKGS